MGKWRILGSCPASEAWKIYRKGQNQLQNSGKSHRITAPDNCLIRDKNHEAKPRAWTDLCHADLLWGPKPSPAQGPPGRLSCPGQEVGAGSLGTARAWSPERPVPVFFPWGLTQRTHLWSSSLLGVSGRAGAAQRLLLRLPEARRAARAGGRSSNGLRVAAAAAAPPGGGSRKRTLLTGELQRRKLAASTPGPRAARSGERLPLCFGSAIGSGPTGVTVFLCRQLPELYSPWFLFHSKVVMAASKIQSRPTRLGASGSLGLQEAGGAARASAGSGGPQAAGKKTQTHGAPRGAWWYCWGV